MSIQFGENNQVLVTESYRAILVGIQVNEDISYSMDELEGLAQASYVEVLGHMVQNLEKPNKATFIGKGKVQELKELAESMEADTVIFNHELSGSQIRNLENEIGLRVIDRTTLILDIFARRATSKEGKLQVELAQLQYRLPRLLGFGTSLSRQGASGGRGTGIGTRGPGEKKLETDRRHIEKRIDEIQAELRFAKNTRAVQRSKREKAEIPVVALVGYTNAGKSAIMNRILTTAEKEEKVVFEKDMLFATLDTAQRNIKLDTNQEFILIDTVGFVSKLPHSLIRAFKGTLEEVVQADLLLHVVDASYENYSFQLQVTEKVLNEIGAGGKPRKFLYNKMDLVKEEALLLDENLSDSVFISAKTGQGMEAVVELIKEALFSDTIITTFLVPYSKGDIVSYLCEKARVITTSYEDNGTLIEVELSKADFSRFKTYEHKEVDNDTL